MRRKEMYRWKNHLSLSWYKWWETKKVSINKISLESKFEKGLEKGDRPWDSRRLQRIARGIASWWRVLGRRTTWERWLASSAKNALLRPALNLKFQKSNGEHGSERQRRDKEHRRARRCPRKSSGESCKKNLGIVFGLKIRLWYFKHKDLKI